MDPDEFYDYDPQTGALRFNDRWSAPSPVPGVTLGEYLEAVAAIRRARRVGTAELLREGRRQADPWWKEGAGDEGDSSV